MKVLNVTYNSKKDETKIVFTEAFNNACGLQKLQIIEDLIAEINKQHDALNTWTVLETE
jgi:hypothetical protein